MVKAISLFFVVFVLAVASVDATPQPVPTPAASVKTGVELYQGLHLPPGLRSRRRAMHRRDIPYGGYLTFGNYPAPTIAPKAEPCKEATLVKEGANRPKPLLGLIDLDLDLHL